MKKTWMLLTFALVWGSVSSWSAAVAQTQGEAVRKIPALQAQNQKPTLILWIEGGGLNLNFIPTGEVIKKVWLDDPSRISLSSDGVLCLDAESDCSNSGATVLHLKRIEPIDFPYLPSTNTTLLSIVTEGPKGRQLYQFEVRYGSGGAQYSTAVIEPSSVTQRNSPLPSEAVEIERGLQVALSKGLISPSRSNQVLVEKVQRFLELTRSGVSFQEASEQAQVSVADLKQLSTLGQEQSANTSAN